MLPRATRYEGRWIISNKFDHHGVGDYEKAVPRNCWTGREWSKEIRDALQFDAEEHARTYIREHLVF